MAATSTYLRNIIRDAVILSGSVPDFSTFTVALYTDVPDEDGNGAEVSGQGYQRRPVTLKAGGDGESVNDGPVVFADMPAVTVRGVTVYGEDGGAVNRLLHYGALNTSKVLALGDDLTFRDGELSVKWL